MTRTREAVWAEAMKELTVMNRTLPSVIPEALDDVLTLETAEHLLEMGKTFYMGAYRSFLGGIALLYQSPEYHCRNIDNLYAFRHLADPESNVTGNASIIQLQQAIHGLSSVSDRFKPVDHTTSEKYPSSLARLTVAVGLYNLGAEEFQPRRLLLFWDGGYVLPAELDRIVLRHMDKADLIVELIRERGFSIADVDELEEILGSIGSSPLVHGAL